MLFLNRETRLVIADKTKQEAKSAAGFGVVVSGVVALNVSENPIVQGVGLAISGSAMLYPAFEGARDLIRGRSHEDREQ